MLQHISWQDYFTAVGICAVIYYLVIGLIWYRSAVHKFLNKPPRLNPSVPQTQEPTIEQENELLEQFSITTKIDGILTKAGTHADKGLLKEHLFALMANQDGLHHPAFRYAVNNHIIAQAKDLCGVDFSAEELNGVWDNLPR